MPAQLLFVQKFAGRGGAKNRLLDTLAALQAGADARLHVITSEEGEFTARLTEMGVPFSVHDLPEWRKPLHRLRFPRAARRVLAALPFDRADWVITNEMWWAPHAGALARALHGRSAVIIRDGIATAPKARKYHLQHNDLLLPSSIEIARGLRLDPELAARTQVFLDSVRVPPATPDGPEKLARQLAGHGHIRQWLLVMGKLGPRKRQVDAVHVLRRLLDAGHEGLGLLLAGDCEPDYEPLMQAAIRDCRVQDRVLMLGNVQDVPALFALRPVCYLTSLREALPGSVIEALGSGRPCFMYPCEGAEDIFGPHLERFVSADFQPALLAEKMHALLADPVRLEAETAALQTRARALFSQEAHLATCLSTFGIPAKPGL